MDLCRLCSTGTGKTISKESRNHTVTSVQFKAEDLIQCALYFYQNLCILQCTQHTRMSGMSVFHMRFLGHSSGHVQKPAAVSQHISDAVRTIVAMEMEWSGGGGMRSGLTGHFTTCSSSPLAPSLHSDANHSR